MTDEIKTVHNITDEEFEELVKRGLYLSELCGKPCYFLPVKRSLDDFYREQELENYLNTHCVRTLLQ